MVTVVLLVALAAFVLTLGAIAGKVPLWVAVLVLCLAVLLQVLPLR
jgi:hypothetical protein